jgi:hypothetical protein
MWELELPGGATRPGSAGQTIDTPNGVQVTASLVPTGGRTTILPERCPSATDWI